MSSLRLFLIFCGTSTLVHSACPFLTEGTPPTNNSTTPTNTEYNDKLATLDISLVFDDIYELLTDSQECWPSDIFNSETSYGPLFIRLAWHCAGTFRDTDQVGGCGGGRQRFWPEASWNDNVNLDKARALLVPIKNKYGDALSWGDLFIFAGTASILNMGGPVSEICAGRVDSSNGELSEPLGPGPQAPECQLQGNCSEPLGADTIGLIYVNAEGVLGNPDPAETAIRIREIFGRMGMNDSETVALIGGGHAFGKAHGACPDGPGASPDEDPFNPWPGLCGTGKGSDTFTSGLEGQWTTDPLQWDNEYFTQLVNDEYRLINGSGNKYQWVNERNGYMMLTTDLALINDENYNSIVTEFANDITKLNIAFSNAWEKLATNGGIWVDNKKCIDAEELSITPIKSTLFLPTSYSTDIIITDDDDDDNESQETDTWFIVGILFICLFAVLLIVVGFMSYKMMNDKNKKGDYNKASADANDDG